VLELWRSFVQELPHLGTAGSRAAHLHDTASGITTATTTDVDKSKQVKRHQLTHDEMRRFIVLRLMGTFGALMLAFGALGAGALPVLENPFTFFPGGSLMTRMMQTASVVVLVGVGFMVLSWVLMAPFVGASITIRRNTPARVPMSMLRRTFAAWVTPIALSAPLFTQDIYSYIAQGSIAAHGLDPYSAGPIDVLGPEHPLVRSVPFIWAHSPSPYGPVALGIAAVISVITNDSVVWGVYAHRAVSIVFVVATAWAVTNLARRCKVTPQAALWLAILNPLSILHLIGGIHNEAILLGCALVGLELGLRALDGYVPHDSLTGQIVTYRGYKKWGLFALGGVLITMAGLVKVTGFLALGFLGMYVARHWYLRWSHDARFGVLNSARSLTDRHALCALAVAIVVQVAIAVATVAAVTALSGINLGWVTGQGGAATIRSWMSITTDIGVLGGFMGMLLGLGDHTDATIMLTRAVGVSISGFVMIRMLFATFLGRIHPVGALGVSTFVLVVLFPVVHPWYMLWAILPLAAWANRPVFRISAVLYSSLMSFFVLPRGLALPGATVVSIYLASAISFIILLAVGWSLLRRRGIVGLN